MFKMGTEEKVEERKWLLTAQDRCDGCSSQAYVSVTGVNGELMFCGHHYGKIMNDVEGSRKMMAYAYSVLDERERLTENRSKGESH
jgi:sulfur transfer protein SufE